MPCLYLRDPDGPAPDRRRKQTCDPPSDSDLAAASAPQFAFLQVRTRAQETLYKPDFRPTDLPPGQVPRWLPAASSSARRLVRGPDAPARNSGPSLPHFETARSPCRIAVQRNIAIRPRY